MADLPNKAKVVVIGGGVVGASCLYHLAKKGWTDCVLLEKNELTAGSTWHAAGNVPSFSTSWAIMNMQRYSIDLYSRLGEEVDYPMNYHQTGSIRLAHSKERMQEFERAKGWGKNQGMDLEILSVEEIKDRYPFIETHDLEGALYDPNDGDIDPAQITQALAKGARAGGAEMDEIRAAGLDIDRGMVVILDGQLYHGDAAMTALALLTTPSGGFNRLMRALFRRPGLARVIYPPMVAGRNATLRLLGRRRIGTG